MPIAVGAALALAIRRRSQVVLAFFGDGAANAGAFHESLNLAAVWRLPVIFVCENNHYAVSTRHEDVTAGAGIASRSASYGIPGAVVDGQDANAVWGSVRAAREHCLTGEGPVLIEAMTYRYDDHSYKLGKVGGTRPAAEIEGWTRRDPLDLHRRAVLSAAAATETELEQIDRTVTDVVQSAILASESRPQISPDRLWEAMYAAPERFRARAHHRVWDAAAGTTGSVA